MADNTKRLTLEDARESMQERVRLNEVTGCLEWTMGKNHNGYGVIKVDGKDRGAHRVAYLLAHGEIPEGMHVLHTCDNRACVNHLHLFLGTNADNIADKVRKDRAGKKLTAATAQEIIDMVKSGATQKEAAERYEVTQPTVSRILSGERRKYLTGGQ